MGDYDFLKIVEISKKLDSVIELLKDIVRMMEENRLSER